jgi:hypothetical protein
MMNQVGDPDARARKAAIEIAMMTDPVRPELRLAYLETLWTMIRSDFGPVWVNLPELRAPLLLRGGTSDIGNLNQIFNRLPRQPAHTLRRLGQMAPRHPIGCVRLCAVYSPIAFPRADHRSTPRI